MTSKEELIEEIAKEILDSLVWVDMNYENRKDCAKEIYNMMERWFVEHV